MHTLAIYFDLGSPIQQTPGLQNYLIAYPSATRVGERLWLIVTDKKTSVIKDEINGLPFMSTGATILVCNVGPGWAYHGFDANTDQWLKDNWMP